MVSNLTLCRRRPPDRCQQPIHAIVLICLADTHMSCYDRQQFNWAEAGFCTHRQLFCVERYPQPPVRRRVESAGKRHASKGMVCVCVCVCVEKNVTPLCVLPHT